MVKLQATATDFELLPMGLYKAQIVLIETKTGTGNDGKPSDYLRWYFYIPEYKGYEVQDNTGMAFGPSAKARKWAQAALQRSIGDAEVVDLDTEVVGKWVYLSVGQIPKQTRDGMKMFNSVEAMTVLPKEQIPVGFPPSPRTQPPSGSVSTYNRVTGGWESDPAMNTRESSNVTPHTGPGPIFPDEAPSPKPPTLGERLKSAIDKLGFEPAQAQQEYRKAITGDAFGSSKIPEFKELDEAQRVAVVRHFEALATDPGPEEPPTPDAPTEVDDIPF